MGIVFYRYFLFFSAVALAGIGTIVVLLSFIKKTKSDSAQATKIANAIRECAMTFLREEYTIILCVVAVIAAIIAYVVSYLAAGLFVVGSITSLATGLIGMHAATLANLSTAIAAKNSGERPAFLIALFGGGVMGFAVASTGLFSISLLTYLFIDRSSNAFAILLTCFGLGASLVAFFARIGGGIYTKSADVGADLVGKLEIGIPEDDPRNPAVIADNVGDCVGDVAGMGADIYESYIGTLVSSMILALNKDAASLTLPLVISAIGLLGSIAGLFSSLLFNLEPSMLLRSANYVAMLILVLGSYGYLVFAKLPMVYFIAILLGCVGGIIIGLITEFYTGSSPVRKLAEISRSGAATNIIYGLSIGMESTVLPVVLLALLVLAAHTYGGGLFGVSLAAVAMLATVGITMTVDAFGAIADNAGGISEMAGFEGRVRKITDKLDALGNTTAAMGKGFAIGSALLAALALFNAFAIEAHIAALNILEPLVLTGMFIGATVPFLVSALTMRSVGEAALQMVFEVRRQFKEIPGLFEGTAEPDYKRCVAISTRAALREMILPAVLTVCVPIVVWYALGTSGLGGLLVGATLVGVLLALMMANGGGAWDNAKKFIEAGNCGGKNSDAHRAAIIGDTVGDPFKDTSGPALNILIKLMSVLALLLVLI